MITPSPSDTGVIIINGSQVNITKVKRQGELIFHKLDGEPPETGVTVKGVLNWDRRYQLMRTHTAFHILCGVIWRDYQASVTGGNMEPLKGRMDFEFETMRQELVKEIEKNVNAEVANARDVIIKILPREEAFQIPDLIRTRINLLPEGITEVRTVEIAGLDLQADGGTHVANTAEVGMVRVTDYKSKGRINKRIHLELE
jgi:misacylated tRNA(Ala) deacylase